jgi:hypothetical protein
MPEVRTAARPHVAALAMLLSAVVLGTMALLTYTGTGPLAGLGPIAALALGAAAFADLLIGIWFFRRGQSS